MSKTRDYSDSLSHMQKIPKTHQGRRPFFKRIAQRLRTCKFLEELDVANGNIQIFNSLYMDGFGWTVVSIFFRACCGMSSVSLPLPDQASVSSDGTMQDLFALDFSIQPQFLSSLL
ncbi:unnamed protein product [Cercopithifilaria johnstoni]|uniref:Uncharacterized protein n=1 Tax=Cercopithifilaria johnstoni TaxID=2874296 RepID=A0A8J2MN54_9BILA|nr:unnamed protein product [Cercopithifilaria johnstoni]